MELVNSWINVSHVTVYLCEKEQRNKTSKIVKKKKKTSGKGKLCCIIIFYFRSSSPVRINILSLVQKKIGF